MNAPTNPWYQTRFRRLLIDMHIGDWDKSFLAKYDTARIADLYAKAGLNGADKGAGGNVGKETP